MVDPRRKAANRLRCPVCDRAFIRRGNRKFYCGKVCCSRRCAAKLRKLDIVRGFNLKPKLGPMMICPICHSSFQPPPSRRAIYCSMKCRAKDPKSFDPIRGSNHYNWKGGVTPANQLSRKSPQYRAWVLAVFKRDGFECRGCQKKGNTLQAHHKYPWASFPSLRFSVSNGVTLCRACHRVVHLLGRRLHQQLIRSNTNEY